MPRPRRSDLLHEDVESFGVKLTLRQRTPGGPIQLDCPRGPSGTRDRHSTYLYDPAKAREYASEYIARLVKLRLGDAPPPAP